MLFFMKKGADTSSKHTDHAIAATEREKKTLSGKQIKSEIFTYSLYH